jgi:hypothetical protein
MERIVLLPLALLVTTAGCLAPAAPGVEPLVPSAAPPEPVAHVFEGRIVVGAAFEVPAHFTPSESYVGPLWRSGAILHVEEAPSFLEFRTDWTAAPGTTMMMMAHAPHEAQRDDEAGWSEYATEFETTSPLCFRIPAEDILAGHWYPMVHTQAGADVDFTITATLVGGRAMFLDGPHGHPSSAEEVVNTAETELGPKRVWDPCTEP